MKNSHTFLLSDQGYEKEAYIMKNSHTFLLSDQEHGKEIYFMKKIVILWEKYKEFLLYIIFGGLTTVINIVAYGICIYIFSINPLISNVIAWIVAVTFAYVTNRRWVFNSKASGKNAILQEMFKFYTGRLATLGIEEGMLFVFVTCLGINEMIIKLIASVAVVIGNFVISKLIVFKQD